MPAAALVDTHCHLNFNSYDEDRAEVVQRAKLAGVKQILIPAIDLSSCRPALALAAEFDGVYVALGIHPNSSGDFAAAHLGQLRALSCRPKVVAIGEIGLDYYWDKSPKAMQQRALQSQLNLAAELALPVILHNREAAADLMPILGDWARTAPSSLSSRLGVLHSFSASIDVAQRAIELGFYIGFTGPITYKKADDLRAIAAAIPRDRILIETDGPFLAPQQRRGKRNEPAYLPYINERLADLHDVSSEAMAEQTTENARRLFALP